MTEKRADIEAFIRDIVAAIERIRADGAADAAAIADRLNADGVTTRKGRAWNRATVEKFLSSPGARRYGLDPDR